MSSEKRNVQRRLFFLVKDLTTHEHGLVISYLKSLNYRQSNFWKLFQLILKSKDEAAFQKSLQQSKELRNSSRYLVEKIIEGLMADVESEFHRFAFIEKAIEKGFIQLAKGRVKQLFSSSQAKVSSTFLRSLLESAVLLEKDFGIAGLTEEAPIPYLEVLDDCKTQASSAYYAEYFKNAIKWNTDDRLALFNLPNPIQGYKSDFPETQLSIYNGWRNRFLVGFDYGSAMEIQSKIVQLISVYPSILPESRKLKESFRLTSMLMAAGRFEEAQQSLMEVGALELKNDLLEPKLLEDWIKYSLFFCACSGNTALGQRIIRDFQKNMDLFSGKWKALLYLAVIVVEIYQGSWDDVVLWAGRLQRLKTKALVNIDWVPLVAKFIAYSERGEEKLATHQLKELSTMAAEIGNPYLNQIVKTFQELQSTSFPTSRTFASILADLESCLESQEASRYANYFDITFWIEAIANQLEPSKWLQSEHAKPIFNFAAVS